MSLVRAGLGCRECPRLASPTWKVGELRTAYNVDRTEAAYLAAIEGKTASLFATACRIGAIVGDLPREQIDALTAFGLAYGMAFQIVDDVLDVTATEAELGKPAGHDLVEGVYTLPVLRALAACDGLRDRLGAPIEGAELDEALSLVRSNGAITGALATAREYAASAVASLEPFGRTEGATWLRGAVDQLFARVDVPA